MNIGHKYLRQCRNLFPVYGKLERTFLNRLKVQINEHLELFPNISYDTLVEQFGTPKEVVMEYYVNVDDDYLLRKTNFVKHIRIFLSIVILILIAHFGYRSYTNYQALQEVKDSKIIIEERGPIIEKDSK